MALGQLIFSIWGSFNLVCHPGAVVHMGQLSPWAVVAWGSCPTGAVVALGQLSPWGSCRLGQLSCGADVAWADVAWAVVTWAVVAASWWPKKELKNYISRLKTDFDVQGV